MDIDEFDPRTLSQILSDSSRVDNSSTVSSFIQHAFGWQRQAGIDNIDLLFPNVARDGSSSSAADIGHGPSGLPTAATAATPQQQRRQQQERSPFSHAVPSPFSGATHDTFSPVLRTVLTSTATAMSATAAVELPNGPILLSPFAALTPTFLFGQQHAAANPFSTASGAVGRPRQGHHHHHHQQQQLQQQQGYEHLQALQQQQQQQGSEHLLALQQQQVLMLNAQQTLMQRQAQLVQQELLNRQQQQQQHAAAAAAAAGGPLDLFAQRTPAHPLTPNAGLGPPCVEKGSGRSPGIASPAAAAAAQGKCEDATAVRRRGRPPKADGQYSEAYLALKKYRARKKSEVDEMEAELAAKKAALEQLLLENRSLKDKHDALEHTLEAQAQIAEQLTALQLTEQAAAAAAAAVGGGQGAQQQKDQEAAAAAAEALVAAVTGQAEVVCNANFEPPPPPQQQQRQRKAILQQQQQQPVADCREVGVLLERYKAYVVASAAALANLATALPQQQQQQQQQQQEVPLAAVGHFTLEQASALGVCLPEWPLTLGEYLVLGNDERIPPSLPAINLLTGHPESIEPEIWQTVATQVRLRPKQVGKVTAAWRLYATSLDGITAERATLMERLKQACGGSSGSSARDTQGATAAAADAARSDAAAALNMQQLDAVLNADEYLDLCGAINANMAREDSIMILFDYAIGNMLDELQLAMICVASWPFMPLLGCICKWLIEDESAAGTIAQG